MSPDPHRMTLCPNSLSVIPLGVGGGRSLPLPTASCALSSALLVWLVQSRLLVCHQYTPRIYISGMGSIVAWEVYLKPGEPFRLSDRLWDFLTSLFEHGQQLGNIVYVRDLYMALNQQCFNRLLHRLLCVETQVLQVDAFILHTRQNQITPGVVQPFPRGFKGVAFSHGRLPSPRATQGP